MKAKSAGVRGFGPLNFRGWITPSCSFSRVKGYNKDSVTDLGEVELRSLKEGGKGGAPSGGEREKSAVESCKTLLH